MWYKDFTNRLKSWATLRTDIQSIELEEALYKVTDWWNNAPWTGYYLHWDDQKSWPDPWQLLSDNIYCDLARGLGILYTLTLTNHKDLISTELVLTEDNRNLVLINKEKYILNWDQQVVVNTPLVSKVKHCFINPKL
jgi:hypothetical protein